MLKNKYLLFAAIFLGYFVSDYIFNDTILYLMGGVIGAAWNGVFKHLGDGVKLTDNLFTLIWVMLLTVNITLFWWVENKACKFFYLLTIATLMYVVDIVVYDIVNFETARLHRLITGICVLIKSTLLFLTVNFTPRLIHKRILF